MTADLSALADRVEREEIAPAIPFLWNDAAKLVWPKYNRPGDDNDKFCEFRRLYNAGAYRDAAAMLCPDGWLIDISEWPAGSYDAFEARLVREADYDAKANIAEAEVLASVKRGPHAEARARCAAALRARAALRAAGGGGGD